MEVQSFSGREACVAKDLGWPKRLPRRERVKARGETVAVRMVSQSDVQQPR